MTNLARLAIVVLVGFVVSPWSVAETRAVPATMAAAAIDRGGGPEMLRVHHLPVPKPKTGEVLIAVQAAGVGVWDADYREHPWEGAKFPLVLGSDGAGSIAAIGSGVHGFKVGDPVYGIGGAFYAEYAAVPAEDVAHIPNGIGAVSYTHLTLPTTERV